MSSSSTATDAASLLLCGDEPQPDDEARRLIEAAGRGDLEAFEALMRRHERRVAGLALRFLGHREDARDAAQEVFLRLFKNLHRLDPERPLEAWLVTVTVNVCRDTARRHGRRSSLEGEAPSLDRADPDPTLDPERRLDGARRLDALRRSLDQLSDNERTALLLRDVEGLPSREVAAVLGTSVGTVRSHICHARLKLRRLLERSGGHDENR